MSLNYLSPRLLLFQKQSSTKSQPCFNFSFKNILTYFLYTSQNSLIAQCLALALFYLDYHILIPNPVFFLSTASFSYPILCINPLYFGHESYIVVSYYIIYQIKILTLVHRPLLIYTNLPAFPFFQLSVYLLC